MQTLSLSSKAKIRNDVLFREIEGEAVILNLATGIYFGLGQVGTRIWHLMEQSRRLKDILRSLLEEYGVEENRCREDLLRLIQALHKSGLVEILQG